MRHPRTLLRELIPLLLVFSFGSASAQENINAQDSLAVKDSSDAAGGQDSLAREAPIPLYRAFAQTREEEGSITEERLPWIDKRFPGDITALVPGAYLRDPNSAGQYSQINFRGTDWRGVAVTQDGRLMNDPASGIYNLYHYDNGLIQRIEVIPGPRAFLYGLNAAGGAINFVSKQFDTFRPYSKLDYSEGSHGYSHFDGTFSQNVTTGANITFGFLRQLTDGRFDNSAHEAWNARARIRYRFSDRFSVILSEYLTSTKTGLNGGIAPDPLSLSNAFFPFSATVRNGDAYEKLSRNDVDLSLVGYFIQDTSSATRLTLYYSNNFREYRDENSGSIPNSVFIQSDHTSSWMGGLFSQEIEGGPHRFTLRSNLELRQIEGSPNLGRRRNLIGSVDAKEEFSVGDAVTLAAYGRYDGYLGNNDVGYGGDAAVRVLPALKIFAGASSSSRFPNYQELYWSDSTVVRSSPVTKEKHTHLEAGTELSLGDDAFIRLAFFSRRVEDPILLRPYGTGYVFPGIDFANGEEVTSQGFDFRLWVRVWLLYFEGSGTFLQQKSSDITIDEYPQFSGTGGVYVWDKFFQENLTLKTGFRGRYQSGQKGTAFNGEILAYVQNTGVELAGGAAVDFVLIGRIGDAYIHFIWENLTEAEYFATPYYPVRDRAIRFGIEWEFLD